MTRSLPLSAVGYHADRPTEQAVAALLSQPYALVLGDAHGHRSYEAARNAGLKVLWIDPNGEDMPVRDTRRMIYVVLREATASGLAQALEEAVRRYITS